MLADYDDLSTAKGINDDERRELLGMIDDLMDGFDFWKVQKMYAATGWTWAFSETGVPTEMDLRIQARLLLKSAARQAFHDFSEAKVSSGGLSARCHPGGLHEQPDIHLSLAFVGEEQHSPRED